MKKAGIVLLCILLIGALAVPAIAQVVDQGCSLGFWKNHTDQWPAGFDKDDLVQGVFSSASSGTDTLLDALKYKGGRGPAGAERILLRQAVAAVLNAAHSGVSYPQVDVVADVNAALADDDRAAMLVLAEELDEYNNLGCPLDEE